MCKQTLIKRDIKCPPWDQNGIKQQLVTIRKQPAEPSSFEFHNREKQVFTAIKVLNYMEKDKPKSCKAPLVDTMPALV